MPYTLSEEPMRAKLLNEQELPNAEQSKMLKLEPKRPIP
jgi:hypothetical protein